MHGAFRIPFDMLGIRHSDQSCPHEVWVHLLHVNARLVDRISRDDKFSTTKFEEEELTL